MLIFGRTFFDLMDFLASNVFLPIAGLLTVIFVAWAWGTAKATTEIETSRPFIAKRIRAFTLRFIVPPAVLYVLITGRI